MQLGNGNQPEICLPEVLFAPPPPPVAAFGSWMCAPKCLFLEGFEGLPEVFDWGSEGRKIQMGGQIRRGRIWRFLGRPNSQSRGPQIPIFKGFWGTSHSYSFQESIELIFIVKAHA